MKQVFGKHLNKYPITTVHQRTTLAPKITCALFYPSILTAPSSSFKKSSIMVMNHLRSSPSLSCFLMASSREVYHESRREIWSYFFTSSVNPSKSCSSHFSMRAEKSN